MEKVQKPFDAELTSWLVNRTAERIWKEAVDMLPYPINWFNYRSKEYVLIATVSFCAAFGPNVWHPEAWVWYREKYRPTRPFALLTSLYVGLSNRFSCQESEYSWYIICCLEAAFPDYLCRYYSSQPTLWGLHTSLKQLIRRSWFQICIICRKLAIPSASYDAKYQHSLDIK
jgi:hypothetical protein